MYALELPASYDIGGFYSLRGYAEVGAVAEKYEIDGLYDSIFVAANRAVAGCSGNHERLQTILKFGLFQSLVSVSSAYSYSFLVKIVRKNLTKLHREQWFHKLLVRDPKMAAILLSLLVDEGNGLKNNNDIDFEGYGEFDRLVEG